MRSMLQPGLLKKRQKYNRDRERGRHGKRFAMQCRQTGLQETAGPSEGQQGPGGGGSAERRSVRTRKLHYRVKSCSYTNIRRNKSLCESHRRPKRETH